MRRIKIPVGVKIFIAIWLLALCVPTVRELPQAFVFADLRGIESSDDFVDQLDLPRSNDAIGEAWRAEVEYRRGDKSAMQTVAARYPNDLHIKANQLFLVAKQLDSLKKARQQPGAAHDERWLRSAQIAREAGDLEPDNVFWPWMEAAFEFAGRRDESALMAFERAAKCTRYQDYSTTINRERIEWLQNSATFGLGNKSWHFLLLLAFLSYRRCATRRLERANAPKLCAKKDKFRAPWRSKLAFSTRLVWRDAMDNMKSQPRRAKTRALPLWESFWESSRYLSKDRELLRMSRFIRAS